MTNGAVTDEATFSLLMAFNGKTVKGLINSRRPCSPKNRRRKQIFTGDRVKQIMPLWFMLLPTITVAV